MMREAKTLRKRPFGKLLGGILVGTLALGLLLTAGNDPSEWALAQEEGGWSKPVMISTNTRSSWFPDVAVDGWGQPHVVWNSGRPSGTGQGQMDLLMYSTLVDQGWLEPNDIEVTAYGGYTVRPAIAVDDAGTLHVTFRGGVAVYYTNSPISEAWNASSWLPRRNISGVATGSAYYSDVAVDEQGGIHVVWSEGVSAGAEEEWLWFGTPKGGAVYDGRGWRSEKARGLADREVYDIIEDTAGVQWFGTDDGVHQFDGVTWHAFTTQDGLADPKVNCIAQNVDGRLWFGTDNGVSVYDGQAERKDDRWTVYTADEGLPGNVVSALATDPLGVTWVGTKQGLASFDGEDWVTHTLHVGNVDAEVVSLAVDLEGNVWAGTPQGVSRYDGKRWDTFTVESGLLSNVVTDIAVDQDGIVWVGTDRGLSWFDGEVWTSRTVERSGSSAVSALMVDREGTIWVGTETGVSLYNGLDWRAFALPNEFAGQRVTAIGEDLRVNAMCPSCADIFYRHSTDGGGSWSAPVNLSNTFAGSEKPQLHLGGGSSVHVTWEEGADWYLFEGYPVASMYVHSPDGGNTWTEPTVFSSTLGVPQQITLGVGPENDLIAIWRVAPEGGQPPSEGAGEVSEADRFYYQLSADNGAVWSEPEPILGVRAKYFQHPSLDAYHAATDSAGNVHLLVLGYLATEENLALIHLVWNGSQWSSPTIIQASSDPPEWPRVDVGAGNRVYATWFTRDEKHLNDTERGRYKIWVSSYQADAPFQTPVPLATSIPTPTPNGLDQTALSSTTTPTPIVLPDGSGLPSGLYTESDEVGRLLLALSPIAVIIVIITALRLGWFRRRR